MSKPPVQQFLGRGVLHHHHHQLSQGSGGSSQLWIRLQLKTFPQVVVNFLRNFSRGWCRNVTFDEVAGNWMLSGSTTPVNCFRRAIRENESALLLRAIITYNQSRCRREYALIISLSFSIPLPAWVSKHSASSHSDCRADTPAGHQWTLSPGNTSSRWLNVRLMN